MQSPHDIRTAYLKFFEERGHAIIPSSPMVPDNDPSTLFTGSGMQPMVPYLLGENHPLGARIVDSQRCFRSQDIEEVGDNRHTTFFEMLGNWSLGDYFKEAQLGWFFEFLTEVIGLDPNQLYVTVFGGDSSIGIGADEESVAIWQELFKSKNVSAEVVKDAVMNGLQNGRIFHYGVKKNWWSRAGEPANMPIGEPGGPDSEVFYDFGAQRHLHENSPFANETCHVNCDCGRFVELGNCVFMQFIKKDGSTFEPLPQKNVDFGGGLERIAAAKQGNPDVFLSGFFTSAIAKIESLSSRGYDQDEVTTRAFRIILDHVRAAVMLASDGVTPSNKEQGYFSRRLLRRAIRYGEAIGMSGDWLTQLVEPFVLEYAEAYPVLIEKKESIEAVFSDEMAKFQSALKKGLKYLSSVSDIDEAVAFFVYETHGFPFELTSEIAAEKGITLSSELFNQERTKHSESSRTASAGKFKGGLQDQSEITIKYHTATHLLHAALRKVLGTHVQQKGSNLTADRLRFDFSHPQPLTDEEKTRVINQVNDWIAAGLPVSRQELPKETALKEGALAFFGTKYPDIVSVYTIGNDMKLDWISKEFCGGPHVSNTSDIGMLALQKEQSVAAGVRRIYLVVAE